MIVEQLSVRPAAESEATEVLALVRQAYRGEESKAGWTTEAHLLDDERIELTEVRAKISRPDGVVLLGFATEAGAAAGAGGAAAADAGAAGAGAAAELVACCELMSKGDGLAYFGMFAVRPALQAAGVGRRMLAEAEAYARTTWQASALEMTVIAQRTELIDWYIRRGYRATGETREFPYGQLVNGTALRDDLYFVVLVKDLVA